MGQPCLPVHRPVVSDSLFPRGAWAKIVSSAVWVPSSSRDRSSGYRGFSEIGLGQSVIRATRLTAKAMFPRIAHDLRSCQNPNEKNDRTLLDRGPTRNHADAWRSRRCHKSYLGPRLPPMLEFRALAREIMVSDDANGLATRFGRALRRFCLRDTGWYRRVAGGGQRAAAAHLLS